MLCDRTILSDRTDMYHTYTSILATGKKMRSTLNSLIVIKHPYLSGGPQVNALSGVVCASDAKEVIKEGITKTYQEHNTHYLRTTNLKREKERNNSTTTGPTGGNLRNHGATTPIVV